MTKLLEGRVGNIFESFCPEAGRRAPGREMAEPRFGEPITSGPPAAAEGCWTRTVHPPAGGEASPSSGSGHREEGTASKSFLPPSGRRNGDTAVSPVLRLASAAA